MAVCGCRRLILLSFFMLSYSSLASVPLMVEVVNKDRLSGKLHLALYQAPPLQETEWQQQAIYRQLTQPLAPSNQSLVLTIPDLSPGHYSLRLFLDENANDVLDMSQLGIPLEAVGFANNPSLFGGMPSMVAASFTVSDIENHQTVKLFKNKRKAKKRTGSGF